MPYRSNASRSYQFAEAQTSTSESITGGSPSLAKLRSRSRQLFATDSSWYDTAKRPGRASPTVSLMRFTPRLNPVAVELSVLHSSRP